MARLLMACLLMAHQSLTLNDPFVNGPPADGCVLGVALPLEQGRLAVVACPPVVCVQLWPFLG